MTASGSDKYPRIGISIHSSDNEIADQIAETMTERGEIKWSRQAVFKAALMRGLLALARENGVKL